MTMKLLEVVVLELKLVEVYANGFIRPPKLPAGTPILFDWKSDGSFWLCVNYRGPYNVPGHVGFNSHDNYSSLDSHSKANAINPAYATGTRASY